MTAPKRTQALNDQHRQQLESLMRAGREHTRLLLSGATILAVSTLTAALAFWYADMGPSIAGLLLAALLPAGVGTLLFTHWRQQQTRFWDPLRAASAEGSLRITRGVLNSVRPAAGGGLDYVVNGLPLHLYPVATEDPLQPLLPGRRIDQHAHIDCDAIELHWLALGTTGSGLLLGVRYHVVPDAHAEQAPSKASDHQRALWRMRDLLWMLGAAPLALLVLNLSGAAPDILGVGLGLLPVLVAGLVILALGFAWRIRQRRQPGQLHTLRGVITERFSVQSSWGDSSHHRHWYRVGSVLYCPGAALQKAMSVGERVRVEELKGSREGETSALVSFGPDPG